MANVLGTLFQDIANAIRSKTGKTNKMSPKDFPSEISNIIVGEGGGASNNNGWVTLIEQQTINPTYNASYGCYVATVPIVDVKNLNIANGTIYIVHLDGISYPIGMSGTIATINKGETNERDLVVYCAGDYTIRTLFFGNEVDFFEGDFKGNEPFYMEGNFGAFSSTKFFFPDATEHIIKVDYMPRYVPPEETVE